MHSNSSRRGNIFDIIVCLAIALVISGGATLFVCIVDAMGDAQSCEDRGGHATQVTITRSTIDGTTEQTARTVCNFEKGTP